MRALTQRQAQVCEEAAAPRCRCRCAGRLHGANRHIAVGYDTLSDALFFAQLPDEDPHKTRGPVQIPLPPDLVVDVRYGAA